MATPDQRRSDIQLVVVATALVIGAGLLIVAGLYFGTRGADSPECSLQRAGSAVDIESLIDEGGVLFQSGGAGCAYLLDTDVASLPATARGLVAYRAEPRDRDCTVNFSVSEELVTTYTCGGVEIPASDLDRYATWHPIEGDFETLLVDLRGDRACDRYDVLDREELTDRLAGNGAVLVVVPDCTDFWLALDVSGAPTAVVTSVRDCMIERNVAGRLTCNGDEIAADRIPAFPTSASNDGTRYLVDLTATPS